MRGAKWTWNIYLSEIKKKHTHTQGRFSLLTIAVLINSRTVSLQPLYLHTHVPIGGVPRKPSSGVGIHHEEIFPSHVLFDGVGLDATEAVQGLLEVGVDRGLGGAVQPFQLLVLFVVSKELRS